MTTLHDRLADLADEVAPTARPPDLWRPRQQRHRRRRVAYRGGGAAVAALARPGAVGCRRPRPSRRSSVRVRRGGTAALPDRFFGRAPTSWLPHGRGTVPVVRRGGLRGALRSWSTARRAWRCSECRRSVTARPSSTCPAGSGRTSDGLWSPCRRTGAGSPTGTAADQRQPGLGRLRHPRASGAAVESRASRSATCEAARPWAGAATRGPCETDDPCPRRRQRDSS